jgi:hypothetical protein
MLVTLTAGGPDECVTCFADGWNGGLAHSSCFFGKTDTESFDERIANMSGKKRQRLECSGVDLSRGSLKKANIDPRPTD